MLIIRRAHADDRAAVAELSRRAYRAVREIYRPLPAAVAEKAAAGREFTRLVVDHRGRLLATVEYHLDREGLHLRDLAVDPDHQRRGVARDMIEELARIGRSNGCPALILYTIRETGNVPVFERLGFRVIGETIASWCVSDRFAELHETCMQRAIV